MSRGFAPSLRSTVESETKSAAAVLQTFSRRQWTILLSLSLLISRESDYIFSLGGEPTHSHDLRASEWALLNKFGGGLQLEHAWLVLLELCILPTNHLTSKHCASATTCNYSPNERLLVARVSLFLDGL